MTKDSIPQTFEQALARLESIVHQLETGSASLEDSIGLYTEGQTLKAYCEAKLADAQARIEKIQVGADGLAAGTVALDPKSA